MSKNWIKDMMDFEKNVMKKNHPETPMMPDEKQIKLRKKLILEEINETIEAIDTNNMPEIADGIVDSIVVLIGTAITYGIDLQPIWDEVYKTNMAKANGYFREDGKLMKPNDWVAPNIKKLLRDQGWE